MLESYCRQPTRDIDALLPVDINFYIVVRALSVGCAASACVRAHEQVCSAVSVDGRRGAQRTSER